MDDHYKSSPPSVLYKYRSMADGASEFTRQIIVDDRIFFPRISDFNDPFDSVPHVGLPRSRIALERGITRAMREGPSDVSRRQGKQMAAALIRHGRLGIQAEIQAGLRQTNNDLGVFCLSAKPDQVLMWSHYADRHTGVALGFRAERPSPFFFAQEVEYSKERPTLDTFLRKGKSEAIRRALTTKADFWAYESEWRLFNLPTMKPGFMALPRDALAEIVLGPAMRLEDVGRVKEWNAQRAHPARLRRATIDPAEFRLHIEDEP